MAVTWINKVFMYSQIVRYKVCIFINGINKCFKQIENNMKEDLLSLPACMVCICFWSSISMKFQVPLHSKNIFAFCYFRSMFEPHFAQWCYVQSLTLKCCIHIYLMGGFFVFIKNLRLRANCDPVCSLYICNVDTSPPVYMCTLRNDFSVK